MAEHMCELSLQLSPRTETEKYKHLLNDSIIFIVHSRYFKRRPYQTCCTASGPSVRSPVVELPAQLLTIPTSYIGRRGYHLGSYLQLERLIGLPDQYVRALIRPFAPEIAAGLSYYVSF